MNYRISSTENNIYIVKTNLFEVINILLTSNLQNLIIIVIILIFVLLIYYLVT